MQRRTITLTTDFGLRDSYVAEMKAVILGICPKITIVDISHDIEKFDIRMGAYVLASASQYFPEGTIHVAIVDPGVGMKRHPLLLQTKQSFYIGPDNGLLVLAAKNQGIDHSYEISNRKLMLPKISNTFHGRDIFAPVAAHLAIGTPPSEIGPEIHDIFTPRFTKVMRRKDSLVGEILHIDGFGNIITNFGEKELKLMNVKSRIIVKIKKVRLKLKRCKTYMEVKTQEPLATIGSHNFLEISINQGNAAKIFNVNRGDKVSIHSS